MDLFENSPIVDFSSIEKIIGVKNQKSNYAKLLISNLIKKNKIKKLSKGKYTLYDDISLIVLCFSPAYLGLQTALSFYGLWEQESIPVVITSRKVRSGMRNVIGGNVLVKRIDKRFIFGFNYVKDGEFYLPYSDIEKTFIDLVVFNQKISEGALKTIRKRLNEKKLKLYLKRYSKLVRDRVIRKYITKS